MRRWRREMRVLLRQPGRGPRPQKFRGSGRATLGAGGKRMTVPALQIQNRLVHPRLDSRGDAALPRGDAREARKVAPCLRDGPADPVACLLTGARPIRDHRDAARRAPREREQRGAYWAARRRPRPLGAGPMQGRPARRPAATSEAAPQCRAVGPSSGRERGSALSAPYRSSDGRCAPSTSSQIGIPFPKRRQVVKQQVTTPAIERPPSPACMPALPRTSTARPVRHQRRGPPYEQPTHSGLRDRQLQSQRPTANRAQRLDPQRVPVGLTELLAELELPVPRLAKFTTPARSASSGLRSKPCPTSAP